MSELALEARSLRVVRPESGFALEVPRLCLCAGEVFALLAEKAVEVHIAFAVLGRNLRGKISAVGHCTFVIAMSRTHAFRDFAQSLHAWCLTGNLSIAEAHLLHLILLLQALHLLGVNHTQSTFRFGGRDMRLTDVKGHVVEAILA